MEKRRKSKSGKSAKIIWAFNMIIIIFIGICSLVLNLEEPESGLTYAKLYFDKELSEYRYEVPASLLGLMVKNSETKDFVINYPSYKGYDENPDLSAELNHAAETGKVPMFLQWDERWGYEKYGGKFIALTGCGPTCLSMVYCGLSQEDYWNPYETAKMSEESGFYVKGSGSSWELMTTGAEKMGLTTHSVIFDNDHIKNELLSGRPVICAMRPGDFTTSGHFIVLAGIDGEGNIIVNDPNSIRNSEKLWDLDELIPQIKNLWSYSYDA